MAVTNTGAWSDAQTSIIARATPGYKYLMVSTIAHAAATATEVIGCIPIPFACTLRGAWFISNAAVSGANTDTTHLNVINEGTAGTGTTELANLDLTSGNDLVAGAKADVFVRVVGINGDGIASPSFGNISVQVR